MFCKIIGAVLAGLILLCGFPAVYAVSISIDLLSVKPENGFVTVSGQVDAPNAGKSIQILVLNRGKKFEDENSIQKADEFSSEASGGFSYTFTLHIGENDESGYYGVTLSVGNGEANKAEASFYYASNADRAAAFDAIKSAVAGGNASETSGALVLYANELGLSSPSFNAVDKQKLASMFIDAYKNNSAVISSVGELHKRIIKLSLIEALNESKKELVFGTGGVFLQPDILELNTLDSRRGVTAASIIGNRVNQAGKTLFADSLLNKRFSSEKDFEDGLILSAVIYGIRNNTLGGTGHISDILNSNAVGLGLNLTNYNSLSSKIAANQSLLTGNYNTKRELQTLLDSFSDSRGSPPGGGSSENVVSSGISGGGLNINGGNELIAPPVIKPLYGFNDMAGYEWAEDDVRLLKALGVISGKSPDVFAPGDSVTREECVKMVVGAFNIQLSGTGGVYSDVQTGDWYKPYIDAAAGNSIVNGYSDGRFGVGDPITRQDISVIIHRIFEQNGENGGVSDTVFTDADEIADYAVKAVSALASKGILNGMPDGSFMPSANCTRAEAAAIVSRAMSQEAANNEN
jgi:hypothetical protein